MTLAIELSNISKSFPGVKANDKINLKIQEGTIHAIVGENGAGKSTLVKILSGVVIPDDCLLYTSPSPRDVEESRMPSSA